MYVFVILLPSASDAIGGSSTPDLLPVTAVGFPFFFLAFSNFCFLSPERKYQNSLLLVIVYFQKDNRLIEVSWMTEANVSSNRFDTA